MTALGIDLETQESILNQAEYERVESIKKSIQAARKYLDDTDWIMTKITEQYLLTGNVDSLTAKYADELSKREEARALINELQA
jgi:hypothetical protein